jgi:hypothetical protein
MNEGAAKVQVGNVTTSPLHGDCGFVGTDTALCWCTMGDFVSSWRPPPERILAGPGVVDLSSDCVW